MKKNFTLLLLLAVALTANRGQATTYTTTTFTDFPITPGLGGLNTTTGQIIGGAGNGQVSLRSAIIASNYKGGTNVINLSNGTYTLTQGPYDDEFNAGGGTMETGDLEIIDLQIGGFPRLASVTLNGAGRDTTIIQMGTLVPSSGGISKDRVLEVNDSVIPQVAVHVTLNNLTIQGGVAPRTPDPDHYNTPGGGIKYDGFDSATGKSSGVLTLNNCKVTGNQSAGLGGGINAIWCSLVIQSNTIVSFNTNQFAAGGGIQYSGGNNIDTPPQTVTIKDSFITNNVASDATFGSGGGLHIAGGGGMTITNTIFAGNLAGITTGANGGGGIHIANMPAVTIVNSIIRSNSSKHNGGGIWCSARNAVSNAAATNTLTGVTVTGNTADSDNTGIGNGGGIYHFFGTMIIQGASHIDGNSAVNGGGIFTTWTGIAGDPSASLTVNGGTIGQSGSGNNAKTNGGAVAVAPGAATTFGTVSLNTVTIVGNSAVTSGGGLFITNGSMSMGFSRVVSNTAPTGSAVARTGGTITVTNNWWGTNAPAASMSGTVSFTPWLQLNHAANPNQIFIPNSTTLTATFLTNSAGTFIPVANLARLVGLPINFNNAVRGSLSGAQATIQPSSTATATFTADVAGAGSANAVVDNQATTAAITIPTGVSSINRVQTTPTNLASVQWTVTFTNAVTNVTAGNFSLVNVGLGGSPGITSVTPVGGPLAISWTVTASTGSGTGTLGLNMVNGTGVSAVIVNLPFGGQVYTIDLVPPDTSITAQPPTIANATSANFSFTGSDTGVGVAGFQCRLDGGSFTNCTSPVNFTGLPDASHTFNVRAVDGAGNVDASPAAFTWVVDTVPPTISIGAPSTTLTRTGTVAYVVTYTDLHFNSSTLAAGNVTLNKTGTANGTVLVSGSGTTRTVTITNTIGDGTMGISIAAGTASDTAGNTAAAAGPSATFTVDNTPPAMTCPTNVTVNTAAGLCSATNVALDSPATSDANGIASVTNNALTSYPVGTNTVTWTVRDNVGLSNTCNQLVIVRDLQPPTMVCPADIITNTVGACPVNVTYSAGATDNCALINLTVTPGTGSAFSVGTNLVTAMAQDASGNSNACTFKVIVLSTPPPAPVLNIAASPATVVLSWTNRGCFQLQYTPKFFPPPATNVWTVHPGPYVPGGGHLYVTNVIGPTNRFFRLSY